MEKFPLWLGTQKHTIEIIYFQTQEEFSFSADHFPAMKVDCKVYFLTTIKFVLLKRRFGSVLVLGPGYPGCFDDLKQLISIKAQSNTDNEIPIYFRCVKQGN